MIIGIICGLAAASSQCISYIFSKEYIHKYGNSFQLLIVSHVIMGAFAALCMCILLLDSDLPPFQEYWRELLAVNGFYMSGQMSFFMAVSKTEASRVAPLLGLKVIFIAFGGIVFLGKELSFWQWFAAILCFGSAVFSNWSGRSIPRAGIFWLLGAVTGYSLSDISIKYFIDCLKSAEGMQIGLAAFSAAVMAYFYLGMFSLLIMLFTPSITIKHLKPAVKFSCWWFLAMLFLFACFGIAGPLFGNIIQSSRGIIAVLLGAVLAHSGWTEYEERLPRKLLARRVTAALLISISIIIFALTKV